MCVVIAVKPRQAECNQNWDLPNWFVKVSAVLHVSTKRERERGVVVESRKTEANKRLIIVDNVHHFHLNPFGNDGKQIRLLISSRVG